MNRHWRRKDHKRPASPRPAWEIPVYILLSLATGGLLRIIFPGFDVRWLAAVALAPLLVAVAREQSVKLRFLYGWLAGVVYWFTLCTWIQFVLEVHGGMGKWGGWACFVLFSVLKAIHLGVFAALAGPLLWRPYAIPAVAALWTGLERTHATFGFAWLDLGNAAISMSLPLRLAPITGVYGLSFVLAMLATAVAIILLRYPRKFLWPLAALGLLYLLPPIPQAFNTDQRALTVQPNVDTEEVWTDEKQRRAEQQLELLSSTFPSHLVVWPELPAPFYYYDDPFFREEAQRIARKHGYFLFGTVAYTDNHQPMNSAVLLGSEGNELGRYDKVNLVPFGEFIPPLFGFVNRITQEAGDFVPGQGVKVLKAGPDNIGVFICYESAFPTFVRQFAKEGANVLFNLSNDGYFGHSAAREQHLLLVRMRAVENRRYIVRSTNDGITSSIDPAGRVIRRLPLYREVAALLPFGRIRERTSYSEYGDWFAWGCLIAGLGLALETQLAARVRKPAKLSGTG
jgi:apolipoprotein N-acyltransferase